MEDNERPARALVIEDDDDIRRLLEIVLTQCGFATSVVANGADGVAEARTAEPALITLDVGLPDVDGYRVAEQLRAFYTNHLIMISARAEDMDADLGIRAGADAYLTKPFRPKELRARVDEVMARPPVNRLP